MQVWDITQGSAVRRGHSHPLDGLSSTNMHQFGTHAQGRTLYSITVKAKKLKPGVTRDQFIANVQKMGLKAVQAEFDRINSILDFDRDTSPATAAQGQFMKDLLRRMERSHEKFDISDFTFTEAFNRITVLRDEVREHEANLRENEEATMADVIDIFSRRGHPKYA